LVTVSFGTRSSEFLEQMVSQVKASRFVYADGLRGLAALAVVLCHLESCAPFHTSLTETLPGVFIIIMRHGWLGVEVFFVLSGFVITYSLRGRPITFRVVRNFGLRRWLRLSPPYYATIALALGSLALSNLLLHDRRAAYPSWFTVLVNMMYCQNLVGCANVVSVFWTLCLEMQFYATFVLLLWLGDSSPGDRAGGIGLAAMLFLNALSILQAFVLDLGDRWLITFWYMFFSGYLSYQALVEGRLKALYLIQLIVLACAGLWGGDDKLLMTAAVMIVFLAAKRIRGIAWVLETRPLQFLGMVSYSLYLIHEIFIKGTAHLLLRLLGKSELSTLAGFGLILACLLASWLFYLAIERPSIHWSKQVKSLPSPFTAKLAQQPALQMLQS
jgi:peptidoglycan/LPS O-acetylase OafA/YrhL